MSPEKKVRCPFCGEEIDADALQCPKCGNRWDDAEEREAIRVLLEMPGMGEKRTRKLYEAGFKKMKDIEEADIGEILSKAGIPLKVAKEVKERVKERKGIYICPECGAFVSAEAEECPVCGAVLSGEEEIEEKEEKEAGEELLSSLEDDLLVEEPAHLYVCGICGAFISEDMEKCPVCGAPMPENRAEPPEKVEDNLLEDEAKNVEAIKKFFGVKDISSISVPVDDVLENTPELDICGNCGAFVRPEAEICPVCGASLIPEIPLEEEVKAEDEALDALEELKSELIGADFSPEEPESAEEEVIQYVCPNCGSEVPEGAETCPVCGAVFKEEEPEKEEAVVLPIEDVIQESAGSEKEVAEEEIKAEVESLLKEGGNEETPGKMDQFELEYGLEGAGLDQLAEIEVKEEEKPLKLPKLEIPKKIKDWHRPKDLIMATTAIGASLIATEYLLTYPVVVDQKMAYGSSLLLVFLPLWLISSLFLFIDRKNIFSEKISSAFFTAPFLATLLLPLRWYLRIEFQRQLVSDIILLSFAAILFVAMIWVFGRKSGYFWIFFMGLSLISIHSILFSADFYTNYVPHYDPVPALGMAVMGGSMLVLGVYLRIDSAVRTLLSTRDVIIGHRYYLGGEYDEAMKYYNRAINRKKSGEMGYGLAYYSKGTALLGMGNVVEALRYLNKAIRENPDNEMAWNNRGIALSRLGLEDAALKSYEKAIEANPDYEVAWNNKGNVLARLGRYEEALDAYERAIELNPDYKDAWINKGYVLIKLDRYRDAKECAEHILPTRKSPKKGRLARSAA